MEHSKLPWSKRNSDNITSYEVKNPDCITIRSCDEWNVARIWLSVGGMELQAKANADFIITACNSFKDLLDLAENIANGVDVDIESVRALLKEIDE